MNQDGNAINGEDSDMYQGTFAVAAEPVTVFPFVEDFNVGWTQAEYPVDKLGPYWSFQRSGGVFVRLDRDPDIGDYSLEFEGGWASGTAEAVLHLDLLDGTTPATGVTLDFQYASSDNEHLEVRPNSGSEWTPIVELWRNRGFTTSGHYNIDVDAAVAAAGLAYTDDFQVRWTLNAGPYSADTGIDDVRVMTTSEDLFGPSVLSHTSQAALDGTTASFDVTFDEAIGSFPPEEIVIFDPAGSEVAAASVTTSDDITWTIRLPAPSVAGVYRFVIGPDVTDASPWANPMNQDGDEINGLPEDVYEGNVALPADAAQAYPFVEDFESGSVEGLGSYWGFETGAGGVAEVTDVGQPRGIYSFVLRQAPGAGETYSAAVLHLDLLDGTAPAEGVTLDFWVQVDGGTDQSGHVGFRSGQGESWELFSLPEQASWQHYVVDVDALGLEYTDDFQVRFERTGVSSLYRFFIDDIRVMVTGEDLFGPRVVSQSPVGEVLGTADTFEVTIDEPISSLPLDQVTIIGPGGEAIAPTAATSADSLTWTVTFPGQTVAGAYQVRIGPNVTDASPYANPMNQDGDRIVGEEEDDVYSGTFTLVPSSVQTYPFLEDFEAGDMGSLGACWTFAEGGAGQVAVTADGGPRDNYHLAFTQTARRMGDWAGAWLHLDLLDGATPVTGATVDYWLKKEGTGTYERLFIYILPEPGSSWISLGYQDGGPEYANLELDLDAIIADNELSYTDDFQVLFRYSGTRTGTTWYLDDVRVRAGGQIRGRQWHDLDGDGLADPDEPGLEGWTIFLDENTDGQLDPGEVSTQTGPDGAYALKWLPAGDYAVTAAQEAASVNTDPVG
ncbi:MAG: SdrD B-like domain-containing protein, partial [Planctomycetota bacterium]